MVSADDGTEAKMKRNLGRSENYGRLAGLWRNRGMTIDVKLGTAETIVIHTILYGSETWELNDKGRRMVEVHYIK